jgi:diguanylate cyclase (GGDEF)-like protein
MELPLFVLTVASLAVLGIIVGDGAFGPRRRQREPAGGTMRGLLLVDLDGFAAINDTLGRRAGDNVLRVVADRLVGAVGPGCRVSHLEGDQFAIASPDDDEDRLRGHAERIRAALIPPIDVNETRLNVTASIVAAAIVTADRLPAGVMADVVNPEDVLARVSDAMRHTKRGRR